MFVDSVSQGKDYYCCNEQIDDYICFARQARKVRVFSFKQSTLRRHWKGYQSRTYVSLTVSEMLSKSMCISNRASQEIGMIECDYRMFSIRAMEK